MTHRIDEPLQRQIDAYLTRLRRALGQMPSEDVSDIVREINGHIIERAESMEPLNDATLGQILDALGEPEDIAPLYQSRVMVARARTSRSPLLILRTTLRWAGKSAGGLATFLFGVFGYTTGLSCLVGAVMKVIMPGRAGLWVGPHTWNLSMGYLTTAERARDHSHEILGWWLVPSMLVVGPLILVVTTFVVRWALRFAFPRDSVR